MLQDVIVRRWREVTGVSGHVQAIAPKDARKARRFFQYLSKLPSEKVRTRLSGTNTERNRIFTWFLPRTDALLNRNLAWLLFNDALNMNITKKVESAQLLLDWAILIAEFGDALKYREEALEIHCEFYRGVLSHSAEDLTKAEEFYARVQTDYRDVGANPILQSLAIYAQGLVALEAGEDARARERFQRALAVLPQDIPRMVKDEVQVAIEGSLHQWQLVNELMKADRSDTLLNANRELVDLELLHMLKARTRVLAAGRHPVTETLKGVRIAEVVADKLGQPINFTDELLNFFLHSQQHSAAEAILREQLITRPNDPELQKKLARTLYLEGKYVEARQVLVKLLKRYPNDASAHSLFGSVLFLLNDKTRAYAHFRRALELDPNDSLAADALRQNKPRATVIIKDGRMALREEDLLRLPPGEIAAAMEAAIFAANPELIDTEQDVMVPSDADQVQKVSHPLPVGDATATPPEPPAIQHLKQAELFFGQARLHEAMEQYRLAIEADPNRAEAYMGLGDVYYRLGQYYLAISYFEESIAIRSDRSTYRFLGDAYVRVGKRKQGAEAYRQALKLDPNYASARQSLQTLLEEGAEDER